jgi:FkbM family methyltransferase
MIVKVRFKGKWLKFYLERRSDFAAFYEVVVMKSYPNLMVQIQKDDTVIDAGGNIGVFTVIASILVGQGGQVISIEPDLENVRILKRNIELNDSRNIEVIDKALYRESGKKIKFVQNGVGSKIATESSEESTCQIEVETISLDDIISQRDIRKVAMKMDIEGAEKFALLGAENTMRIVHHFEGEIHSKEDLDVLMRFSNQFSFQRTRVKKTSNVVSFGLRHPLKIIELECFNQFRTTKRILYTLTSPPKSSEFPLIVYGERLS